MKVKLAVLVLLSWIVPIIVQELIPNIFYSNNYEMHQILEGYLRIFSFLGSFVYLFILFNYGDNKWITIFTLLLVVNILVNGPYQYLYVRIYTLFGGNDYESFFWFLIYTIFVILIITLVITTIMLFIREINVMVRIIIFVSSIFGIWTNPYTLFMLEVYFQVDYSHHDLILVMQVNSVISLFILIGKIVVTYILVRNYELRYNIKLLKKDY